MLLADALVGLGYVSLARAASEYYGRTRHSKVAQAAEDGNASRDEILNWYAYWLVQHGSRGQAALTPPCERKRTPGPASCCDSCQEMALYRSEIRDGPGLRCACHGGRIRQRRGFAAADRTPHSRTARVAGHSRWVKLLQCQRARWMATLRATR
jgi:hypothetical protein